MLRVKEAPPMGLALTLDGANRLVYLDPYEGARLCVPPTPPRNIFDDDPATLPGLLAAPGWVGSHRALPKPPHTTPRRGGLFLLYRYPTR